MYLIQILLPARNNSGRQFPGKYFKSVSEQLTARFHGLTVYDRAPAKGRWQKKGRVLHDEIVVYEVMASRLDKKWWRDFRSTLERRFRQSSIVVRAQNMTLL